MAAEFITTLVTTPMSPHTQRTHKAPSECMSLGGPTVAVGHGRVDVGRGETTADHGQPGEPNDSSIARTETIQAHLTSLMALPFLPAWPDYLFHPMHRPSVPWVWLGHAEELYGAFDGYATRGRGPWQALIRSLIE